MQYVQHVQHDAFVSGGREERLLCFCSFFSFALRCQVGLGDIVSLAKTWKKLSAEDLLAGDQAALASAVKVGWLVIS